MRLPTMHIHINLQCDKYMPPYVYIHIYIYRHPVCIFSTNDFLSDAHHYDRWIPVKVGIEVGHSISHWFGFRDLFSSETMGLSLKLIGMSSVNFPIQFCDFLSTNLLRRLGLKLMGFWCPNHQMGILGLIILIAFAILGLIEFVYWVDSCNLMGLIGILNLKILGIFINPIRMLRQHQMRRWINQLSQERRVGCWIVPSLVGQWFWSIPVPKEIDI